MQLNLDQLKRDAEAGIPGAQFNLGLAWLYGDAGEHDPFRAWNWLSRAADGGMGEAHALLGTMCVNGNARGGRGRVDMELAMHHYRRGVDAGSLDAGFRLGLLQLTGQGIERDAAAGAARVEHAAHAGHPLALMEIAHCLEYGLGVARAPARALKAWQLAARAGQPRAWLTLGCWLADGHYLERDPALARACVAKANEAGYPLAEYLLAAMPFAPPEDAEKVLQRPARATSERPAPVRERIRTQPRIELIHGLLPPECRAHLIDRARPLLRRSQVLQTARGQVGESAIRTSGEMAFHTGLADATVFNIERMLHATVDLPHENGEPLVVIHYTPGTEYKPHYDYFDPDQPGQRPGLSMGGQRLFTLLTYLNPVDGGGSTSFPEIGVVIQPRAGTTLLFSNIGPDGRIDPDTLHAGDPVTAGEKWLTTRWIRESRFHVPDHTPASTETHHG